MNYTGYKKVIYCLISRGTLEDNLFKKKYTSNEDTIIVNYQQIE